MAENRYGPAFPPTIRRGLSGNPHISGPGQHELHKTGDARNGWSTEGSTDMVHRNYSDETGLTGLEVIVIILVLIVIGHVLITTLSKSPAPGSPPPGMLGTYAGESGYAIRHSGPVTVFSAVNGRPSDVTVRFSHPDPTKLGAIEMTVALFMGDMGGVDFDKVALYWTTDTLVEKIPRKNTQPLVCPGWTIADRFDVPASTPANGVKLPNKVPIVKGMSKSAPNLSANVNDVLYPDEQFEIFVCPTNTTPPYQQFTITVNPPGSVQPPVAMITVPVMDQPVITLNQI